MSKLITDEQTRTISISNATMDTGTVGDLIAESTSLFLDADGATDIDGINIPLLVDRNKLLVAPPLSAIAITAATEILPFIIGSPGSERKFRITPASQTLFKVKEKVSIGTFSGPSYIGSFQVVQRIPVTGSPDDLVVTTRDTALVAGDLVGEELYSLHRYSGSVKLGFVSLNLGSGVSGATVRIALIVTSNPLSGADYATRKAAGEVYWSRFYPLGTQVSVDFGGYGIQTQGFVPPVNPLAPSVVTNAEKRLMLALYWESGTPIAFKLDADITYLVNTLYEINA